MIKLLRHRLARVYWRMLWAPATRYVLAGLAVAAAVVPGLSTGGMPTAPFWCLTGVFIGAWLALEARVSRPSLSLLIDPNAAPGWVICPHHKVAAPWVAAGVCQVCGPLTPIEPGTSDEPARTDLEDPHDR